MNENDVLKLRRDIGLAQLRDLLWEAYCAGYVEAHEGQHEGRPNRTLSKSFDEWVKPNDVDPWDRSKWA